METISIGLTVYFEDGFWHGLFEQVYRENLSKFVVWHFGQEPKDDEILEMLQTQFTHLSFSPEATVKQHVKIKNPKRLQRAVKKQVKKKISSKSKELLQLQYEERKKISKHQSSVQKQLLKQEKFERKQQNEETSIKDINPYLFHQKSFGRKNPTEAF